MSRVAYLARTFRCLRCMADRPTAHFKLWFWTSSTVLGRPVSPSYRDLRCPYCGANPAWFEPWPRRCTNFLTPLREDLRPVVFRWHDKKGHEHYRYPASTDPYATGDALPRTGPDSSGNRVGDEERIDFPTLRSMEHFLKDQNPNYRDWTQPLNDLLDYDEAHLQAVAEDDSDPEAAELAAELEGVEFGATSEEEIKKFMERTDGTALIEKA